MHQSWTLTFWQRCGNRRNRHKSSHLYTEHLLIRRGPTLQLCVVTDTTSTQVGFTFKDIDHVDACRPWKTRFRVSFQSQKPWLLLVLPPCSEYTGNEQAGCDICSDRGAVREVNILPPDVEQSRCEVSLVDPSVINLQMLIVMYYIVNPCSSTHLSKLYHVLRALILGWPWTSQQFLSFIKSILF